MNQNCEVVVIKINHEADGLYTATSPDLQGVCIVHRDKDRIVEDMPNIVRLWYRRHRGQEVEAFWGPTRDMDGSFAFPMCTVPAEVAARAMKCCGNLRPGVSR